MLFNSIEFIVFFVFVVTVISIYKNRRFQHFLLLGASLFFFYYSSNYLIFLLIFVILIDYYFGKLIWSAQTLQKKKNLLIISIAANLGILGFFKYVNFGIEQVNLYASFFGWSNLEILNIALPIGISFYTFQAMSYTIDIYRGKISPCNSIKEFALFVSFFPQLVAGPIVRASVFLPQLREKIENINFKKNLSLIVIHNPNLKMGVTIMAFGFFKKMIFADNIAPLVNDIFDSPLGHESFTIILGAIAFGIQIYADFSGYSDIAIGAALILGFQFPMNFNKPYFATSPSDFWRRWHISLSTWLRDYLYIPLGGNRKSSGRTYFNLAIVMLLGGLWHGAAWNFIVWGMLHGLYLAIHKLMLDKFPRLKNNSFFRTKIGFIFSILITQYLVFLTWIAFRVKEFNPLTYSLEKYIFLDFATQKTAEIILDHKFEVFLIGLFFGLHYISYKKQNLPEIISKFRSPFLLVVLFIISLAIISLYNGNPQDFIYFQF